MTRASGQVGVALRSCHWRCGNADDCCGDLAALAVQRCWLIYAHVQTGATAGENVRKSWIRIILEKRFGQKMNRESFRGILFCPRPAAEKELLGLSLVEIFCKSGKRWLICTEKIQILILFLLHKFVLY